MENTGRGVDSTVSTILDRSQFCRRYTREKSVEEASRGSRAAETRGETSGKSFDNSDEVVKRGG